MLPAHLIADTGLRIIKDAPNLPTKIYLHVGDLDVSASYPWGQACLNISRKTTRCELIDIEGISDHDRRMQGINMSGGATNAVEFCTTLLKLPTPVEWLEAFTADLNENIITDGGSNIYEMTPVPHAFKVATKPVGGFDDIVVTDIGNGSGKTSDEEDEEEETEGAF